ncbi:MAG: hypothetical protein V4640_03435 [Verrucomicrobiota bacterium]
MIFRFAPLLTVVLAFTSCEKAAAPAASPSLAQQDMPLLPVTPGDRWTYQVELFIPAGVTSPSAAEVEQSYERSRTYLGKMVPAKGLPEVDCFEIDVPGFPKEREFVEIHDDAILLRGSMTLREEATSPLWFSQPVPFLTAGLNAGDALPDVSAEAGGLSRKTQVEARETISVLAGTFPCIRLRTTGMDGNIELSETLWFSPGTGIICGEKVRKRGDMILFREHQKLTAVRMEHRKSATPPSP